MSLRFSISTVAVLIILAVVPARAAKQGICHACKCDSKATACVKQCNSKRMCVMACGHACIMRRMGIKSCPKPKPKFNRA